MEEGLMRCEPARQAPEAVVGSGKADFDFQEAVTYARLSGVPIRSIAAVIQHNTSGFASMASRGLRRRPIEGKRTAGGVANGERDHRCS